MTRNVNKPAALLAAAAVALAAALPGCPRFQQSPVRFKAPEKEFVTVRGIRIHYLERKPAKPEGTVVFIHGFASASVVWKKLMKKMGRRYRVVALDLPGFGLSDKRKGDYSPQGLARVVAAFMKRLNIPRAHIVAHSWGCSVALALALNHPKRVQRLALIGAWVYESQMVPFLTWSRVRGLGEFLFTLFYKERVGDRYATAFHNPKRHAGWRTVRRIKKALDRPGAVRAALQAVRQMRFTRLARRYPRIKNKTLLLWGRQDRVSALKFGKRLAGDLPRSRLKVLDQCGHFPMIERLRATYHHLLVHFKKDRPAAPPVPPPPPPRPPPAQPAPKKGTGP
jgi:pimeloyl-ACP methyl ester carboxylesterase